MRDSGFSRQWRFRSRSSGMWLHLEDGGSMVLRSVGILP